MSLNRVAVHNFQSLRDVTLELGVFTVIVGPSSSGKSALMRAFRAVASNVRGCGMITRGQKHMAVSYRTDDRTVTLERTEKSGTYRITDTPGGELAYTKLAGEVPEAVTKVLALEPVPVNGTSVNFASQFDKPYLLDESGATIARVLGELTNVNLIFEAVREANKVRLNAAARLKIRHNDLAELKNRLAAFTDLPERLALFAQAEAQVSALTGVQQRTKRLDAALMTLRIAQRALDKAVVPEVPPSDRLDAALTSYRTLHTRITGLGTQYDLVDSARRDAARAVRHEEAVTTLLGEKLRQAGVCPTCGQQTV